MTQYAIPTLPDGFALRPIAPDDMPYLRDLYASTRTDLAQTPWSDEQKAAFIQMQFEAQHTHYHSVRPQAGYYVVLHHGQAIGRIYIDWERDGRLHLMEITLEPRWRGQGIGTTLLRWLMDEAARRGVTLSLYVEDYNPAYRLYQRLGFITKDPPGIYTYMTWEPPR
jgi:GNAT superfamily N-acetyltransferase